MSNAGDNPSATLAISENRQHAPHEDHAQSKQQSLVPNGAEQERDRLLAECCSPERLVTLLIRQQSISLKIFDTKPYFEKFGLTDKKVLMIIQELNTDASRHILEIYRYLHANASRKYSCSELAEILQMKEGTTRRICYVMATLNIIRVAHANTQHKNYMILCFYADEAIAA